MSHNIHLVVVKAESGADACSTVETELEGWGNEDNYRIIFGAVSADNEVYEKEKSRHYNLSPKTIEGINKMVREWVEDPYYDKEAKNVLENYAQGKPVKSFDWVNVSRWADLMHERQQVENQAKGKPFNVLEHSFFEYHYDELGVTHLSYEGEKKWVVFVDMHS